MSKLDYRSSCVQHLAYLILRKRELHVVVKPVVEHAHGLLTQLCDAIRVHSTHRRQPWQQQQQQCP